ncbi:amino acid ABC transporter substrate-binding protein, partial [Candidatus Korarchaeum cryptofilum]
HMRRGISTPVLALLLIVVLLIGVAIGYFIPRPGAAQTVTVTGPATTVTVTATAAALPSEILIGSPLGLSGAFASFGARQKAAIEMAQEEINEFLKKAGIPTKFTFLFEDTEQKPDVSLAKVQSLAAKGVKVFVGFSSSGEIRGPSAYLDTNKLIAISGSSTAPRGTIGKRFDEGSYIFRVLPTCEYEGRALAKAFIDMGFKKAAIITTKDAYSEAIEKSFIENFQKLGGEVVAKVSYQYGVKTYAAEMSTLEDALTKYSNKEAALLANMWEDVALFLQEAKARNSPLLNYVWFGTDCFAQSTIIINEAGDIAAKVKLISVLFEAPHTQVYYNFVEKFKKRTGQMPDIYAMAQYDAAWIAALSILAAGSLDTDKIREVIPVVCSHYYGVIGNPALLPTGDAAIMDVAFYSVKIVDGKPTWVSVGIFNSALGTLTWTQAP